MPIDYAALAKQAGATSSTPAPGKVDYAALANQAGAVSSTATQDAPVAGAGDYGVPGFPAQAPPEMKPSMLGRDASPGTAAQRLLGDKPLTNSATVVGQHLKNMVTGPYHAFTDAPSSPIEQGIQGTQQNNTALGLYRMLGKPTIEGEGLDRVPIAGPWARGVENDAKTYGAIPALLGLGTDIAAPKAAEGLYGGATNLAGKGLRAAASTPDAIKVAATRGLVTGTPGELLNRSLKPPVTKPDFEQSVEASLPSIAAQNPKGVKGFASAAETSKNATNDWYQNLKAPHAQVPIDTTPIYKAQMNSVPITNQIENPGIFDSVSKKASNFQSTLPLETVDDVRVDTNAKLRGLFNKNGPDRFAALSDPETARVNATNHAARDLVYNRLEKLSGVPRPDIEANQNLYGHLSDVSEVAGKRATVSGRANPMSLQESLQLHGNPFTQAYNFGTSRLFKGLTDSDAVTNAAIDRFQNPNTIQFPTRNTPFARLLSTTGTGVGGASKLKPFFGPSIAARGSQKKSDRQ